MGLFDKDLTGVSELGKIGIGVVFEALADGLGKLLKVGVNAVVNLVKVKKALNEANECLKKLVTEINYRSGDGEQVLVKIKAELTQNGFFKKSGLGALFKRGEVSVGDFGKEFLNSIDFDVDRIMELNCVKELTDTEKKQVELAFKHLNHAFIEYYNEMLPKDGKMLASVLRYHFETVLGEKMEELRDSLDAFLNANTKEVEECPICAREKRQGHKTSEEELKKPCAVVCEACGNIYSSRVIKDVNTDLIKTVTDGLNGKLEGISAEISALEASLGKKIEDAEAKVIASVSAASDDGKRHTSQETDRAVEAVNAHSTACVEELRQEVQVAVNRPTTTNTNNGTVYNYNGTGSGIAADTFAVLYTDTKAKLDATEAELSAEIASHGEDKCALESALAEIAELSSSQADELDRLRAEHSAELKRIRSKHEAKISEKEEEIAKLGKVIDDLQKHNAFLIDMYKSCNYPLPEYIEVGMERTFGYYPQTREGTDKTPIEWQVLDIKDGKALLISKYAIDNRRFNENISTNKWAECSLRKWLNSDENGCFFDVASFTSSEMEGMVDSGIEGAEGDKVFLLSTEEAGRYFKSAEERICKATAYAQKMGAWFGWSGTCNWWLRSPGSSRYRADYVYRDGVIFRCSVDLGLVSVRPALWVTLESLIFKS